MTSMQIHSFLRCATYPSTKRGTQPSAGCRARDVGLRDGVWPGGAIVKGVNGKPVAVGIRERLGDLTALEARVISALVSEHLIDDRTLLKVVASEAKVSQAMVVKIAKKLGFAGFRSLRAALAEHNRLPLREIREELSSYQTAADIAEKVCRATMNALDAALSAPCLERLEEAAECIWSARQRDLYGVGGSAQVARDAAFKFLRIGIRTSAFDDGCMMSMSASLLRRGDVAVAVSFSGQDLTVLDAVRQVRKNGGTVIAIINRSSSVLAQEANFTFSASADECPLTGETAAVRMAQLSIVDALVMAVARIDPTAAEANLGSTISALRAQRAPW